MRKTIIRSLVLLLCLTCTAGTLRAQQTAAESAAAPTVSVPDTAAPDATAPAQARQTKAAAVPDQAAPADAAPDTRAPAQATPDTPAAATALSAPNPDTATPAPAPANPETAAPERSSTAPALPPATAPQRPMTINEMRRQRGLTDMHSLFVPKGQWIFGGTASWSTHTNDRYQFLIIEDIDSKGYTFRVSPMIAYAVRDNMAVGARFVYARSLLQLDNAHLRFGDDADATELRAKNFYTLTHSYTAAVIWRQYIPLGSSKRFALFNEMQLSAGSSQAKFTNDSPVKGTYQTGYSLSLGFAPGIVAFATNNMAVEINVGVMGISYNHIKQVHNQVQEGKLDTSMMNFKVNIFSIGLGMAFYL